MLDNTQVAKKYKKSTKKALKKYFQSANFAH